MSSFVKIEYDSPNAFSRRMNLFYGRTELGLEPSFADRCEIIQPKKIESSLSPQELIRECLSENSFRDVIVKGARTAVIIPDKSRYCNTPAILPILVAQLNEMKIADSDICFVIATGSHAPQSDKEIEDLVGHEIKRRIEVIEHDCRNSDQLVYLGTTAFGTPVWINKAVVECENIVIIGTAVHHYFAGFGGGPKMVNPGCAGYNTIIKNHALTIDKKTGSIHRRCRPGCIAGNPVQEDIRESMQWVRVSFLLETVFTDDGTMAAAYGGPLYETHARACELVDAIYKVSIGSRADLVVVSCGGYPRDINYVQAHKSLFNGFQALKPGGVLILLAECGQGIGSQTFLDWFKCSNDDAFVADLAEKYTLNATTALSTRDKSHRAKIILVSELPDEVVLEIGMNPAASLDKALDLARSFLPAKFRSVLMPNGAITLPEVV